MDNKNKKITFKCLDGEYTLDFYIAIHSKTFVLLLESIDLDKITTIPVLLTKKHLQYFEFLIYNNFYPPTSNEFLFQMIKNIKTNYPRANLNDQIIITEAFEYLDIKNQMGFNFISNITFEGSFYSKKNILWVDIKQFFDHNHRNIYNTNDVLVTLKEFKENKKTLNDFIGISDKRMTCQVCLHNKKCILPLCSNCKLCICENSTCKYGELCYYCNKNVTGSLE
uniref:Uncharacterized protein n=1 Tax=Pithovirus LCPAC001 TaxID=2506585 RepID=A0A481Z2X9_9VIRU|nr:MAG: hypothetical protein LCPAC001_02160 [Pithovirus LCPAC001]